MNIILSLWSDILSDPLLPMLLLVLVILMLLVLIAVVIQFGTRIRYLATSSASNSTVKAVQEKADHILVDAREQGIAIRMHAQMEAGKIFTDRIEEDEKFRVVQAEHLEEIAQHTKDLLIKQVQFAEKALQDESESIKKMFSGVSMQAQKEYQGLMEEIKKRMSDELSKEIDLARQAVTVYKQQRFVILNKEIVGLVEDTARIALNKSLSLDDHRGIILAALAEAKREGVFGTPS